MTIQLIDSFSDGSIQLNDVLLIPIKSSTLFEAVILNCQKDRSSRQLLDQLYLLSAACCPLNKVDMAEIAQMQISEIEGLLERLSELLQVSLDDPEQGSGRIETENFRAFLVRNYAVEVALAEKRLLNYWGVEMQSRQLKYNVGKHQYCQQNIEKHGRLKNFKDLQLVGDLGFNNERGDIFGFIHCKGDLHRLAIEEALFLQDRDAMIHHALCLVSLKCETLDEVNLLLVRATEDPLQTADVLKMLNGIEQATGEEQRSVVLLYTLCLLRLTLFVATDHSDRRVMIQQIISTLEKNKGNASHNSRLAFIPARLLYFILCAIEDEGLEVGELVSLMDDWISTEDRNTKGESCASGMVKDKPEGKGHWFRTFRSVEYLLEQNALPNTIHDIRQEALEALRQMSFVFNGCITCEEFADLFIPALDALEDKSQEDLDLELALVDGFMINEKDDMLRDISENLCLVGRHDDAIRVVQQMIDDFHRNDALGSIVAAYMEQGKMDQAMVTADSIQNDIIGFGVYRDLAMKCKELGWRRNAVEMVVKADAFAERVDQGIVRDFYFRELTDLLLTQDLFDQAIDAVVKIENTASKSLAMGKIVQGLSRAEKFDTALEYAVGIEEPEQRKDALFEVASLAAEKGYVRLAQHALKIIVHDAKAKNDNTSIGALYILKDLQAQMSGLGFYSHSKKALKEAISITNNIKASPSRINGELLLCEMLCVQGEFHHAGERVLLLEGTMPKISGLCTIVRSMHQQKKHSGALATLSIMSSLINERLEELPVSDIYLDLAILYDEIGFYEDAQANLIMACNYIKQISSDRVRRFETAVLAEKIIKQGLYDWIKVISDFFPPGKVKEDFLNMSSYTLTKYGRHDMAIECASIMEDECKRNSALIFISDAFSDEDMHQEAARVASRISLFQEKNSRLENIAIMAGKHDYIKNGLRYCFDQIESFWQKHALEHYKEGIVSMLKPSSTTEEVALTMLPVIDDIKSMEIILKMYALNCLFFTTIDDQKLVRFNSVIDLDWAIGIRDEMGFQSTNHSV